MVASVFETRIRPFLLLLALSMFAGSIVELLLQEHFGEPSQMIPFVVSGLGIAALVAVLIRPNPATIRMIRFVLLLVIGAGLLGIFFHLQGNVAFEMEIRPGAMLSDIWIEALMGANPLFAPGILVYAALIAAAATYHHPCLQQAT
jgi:hypothetical protein